ncbi:S8 family peptidase [Sorangium sp. So ce542]|uniref:S8 family peptidase n=1 Tax=Sorangium sp. So ce542 TaxID=3133316 RepID=UPI003F600071
MAEQYTSPQRGGGTALLPPIDRGKHGAALKRQLDRAWNELRARDAQHSAVALEARQGVYLEFSSAPGFELALHSLDVMRAGIELVATRTRADVTHATVYVPNGQLGYFEEKIEEYLTQSTPKGNPKNKPLIESIAEIRLAVLEGFWTDDPALFPPAGKTIWWEVWLRGDDEAGLVRFREQAQKAGITAGDKHLMFPDRLVVLACATREQMTGSIELLDVIAELRLAKEVPAAFTRMIPADQNEWAKDLEGRISEPSPEAPALCIVDTGVNAGHPLLEPATSERDLHACDPTWGVHDDQGHGTEMAGIALYGDLTEVLLSSSPMVLTHRIESVKILRKGAANPPELYGAITAEGVARAEVEAPHRNRAISMAIATTEFRDRGQPSSWSAEIDKLCSGMDDDFRRLFLVSAGNVDDGAGLNFRARNETDGIHDPGQSWNAVTVGAYTERTRIVEPIFDGWRPVARPGELSPSSTTSCIWQPQWPLKPEIVMEGGNMALSPDGSKADFADSLSLLTTYFLPYVKPFVVTGDTSAATAGAARVAATIWARYPSFWPETIRALLVHAAEWTHPMRAEIDATRSSAELAHLLRCFGFGVPNLERALWSAGNALTLVVQEELRPFERDKSNEMHLHTLPWPAEALRGLGDVEVELRVTLSYFIEPNPARRGWRRRHRYASHGLRFAVQKPTETRGDLRKRVNKLAREEGDEEIDASDRGWLLGPSLRGKGSLHHDRWVGTAADLANRESIAIFPVVGWWRERHQLDRWKRAARYALVVSIRTPETGVDIYEPVASRVKTTTAVPT